MNYLIFVTQVDTLIDTNVTLKMSNVKINSHKRLESKHIVHQKCVNDYSRI
jgi:hypothetical protein